MSDIVTPLNNHLLIRREPRATSAGGIVLPETAAPAANIGRVVARGEYADREIGILVVWDNHDGLYATTPMAVDVEHDGAPHVLVHCDRVVATVQRT